MLCSRLVVTQVVVKDAKEVEGIRQREMDITKERIQKILATGANVILTTKGIDDLCLKYFVEAGALAVGAHTLARLEEHKSVRGGGQRLGAEHFPAICDGPVMGAAAF